MSKYYKAEDIVELILNLAEGIGETPTIEVSEGGKWIRKDGRVWSKCSVCGSGSSFETKYCGSCGARMKEADK